MANSEIRQDPFIAFTAEAFNSDALKSGGLREKHAVATWEASQLLLDDTGETQGSLCQDRPGTYWSARQQPEPCNSPAPNTHCVSITKISRLMLFR
jgi:hypothetical protein